MTLVLFLLTVGTARAQVATGTPPFGSFSGGPDIVNNANLNVHSNIPVFTKGGNGLSFYYILSNDTSVWYPLGGVWTPVSNWGWRGNTESMTGYTTYSVTQAECWYPQGPSGHYYYWHFWYAFTYHDTSGIPHSLPGEVTDWAALNTPCGSNGGYSGTASGTVNDGSGYAYTLTYGPSVNLHASGGTAIIAPLQSSSGNGTLTSRNGNTITGTYAGGTTTFTDTLGVTALTVSGSGTPSSPYQFQYQAPSGGQVSVKMNFASYTVETHFGCNGVTDYGRTTQMTQNLVNSVSLPDGTSYSITYEPTPSPNHPGAVTGRIASITLPTGGVISYTYTGANNGIMCGDGSAAGLNRTTPDSVTPWQYTRAAGPPASTTITDPLGNQTVIDFQGIYETERKAYQGTAGGSALLTVDTCYNGAAIPCTGTAVALPINNRTVQSTPSGVSPSKTYTAFNSYGLPTVTDEYGFGPTFVRETMTCYASFSNKPYLVDRPSAVEVYTVTGNPSTCTSTSGLASSTGFGYDSNDNPQSEPHYYIVNGSWASINRGFIYSSAGVLQSATDFNGSSTNYAATGFSCNNAFPNSVSPPVIPTTNLTWDCNGAVVTKVSDANSQPTNFIYNDSMWRLTNTGYADGGSSNADFTHLTSNPPYIVTSTGVTAGVYHQVTTTLDGLGRVIKSVDNSSGATVDTTYDGLGRVRCVSNPYTGSYSGPACGQSGFVGDTYAYDALGRVTKVTHADNSYAQVSYPNNCATTTDEAGNSKTLCTDGLGRMQSVADATGTTTYSYDALDDLISVTQGSETRSYQYDMLGRLTKAITPESGETDYAYNSNGDLTTRVDARGITTCYGSWSGSSCNSWFGVGYDALHRLLEKSYSDGTPTANYAYDQTSIWGNPTQNPYGRLTMEQAATNLSPSSWTAEVFYWADSVGRVLATDQCTPSSCGSFAYGLLYAYDEAGDLTSYNVLGARQINFTYDSASRLSGVTSSLSDSNHPGTLLSGTSYGPVGLTADTLGNHVAESFGYDNRTRLSSISSTPYTLGLTYTGNGSLLTANDSVNGSWAYGYDSLNRINSAGKSGLAFTYAYDQYGNRTQQNVTQGSGPAPRYSFDVHNHITNGGFSYDAAGNLLQDGYCQYTWDGEERLSSATCAGTTTTYIYDAEGRRVAKAVNGTITQEYVYNLAGQAVSTYGPYPGMTWIRDDIWAGGRHLGTYANGTTYFHHADHLGTERARTDVNGHVVETCTSLPFGDYLQCAGSDPSPYHTFGFEHDNESTDDHAWFRYYDSSQGRWLSPDPAGLAAVDLTNPQSLNRYAYVMNSPTNLTDPLGLCNIPSSATAESGGGQLQCPGSYNPYNIVTSQGVTINAGAQFEKMSTDFAAGEAAYAAHVNAIFDMKYLSSMAEEYGGIPADQVTAFLSTHPDLKLNYGLLWEEQRLSIFSGALLDQRAQIYGYSVVENPLQLAGLEASPMLDASTYAEWTGAAAATGTVIVPGAWTAATGAAEDASIQVVGGHPQVILDAGQFAQGLLFRGPITSWWATVGRVASAGWLICKQYGPC
ncbi:MAG TPA: RHS repeat-associated core domain-containing protein [Terriglobia bacterium]|nr:RHS repeat-associated core domain-containing protein [Terriglobia bacterium]